MSINLQKTFARLFAIIIGIVSIFSGGNADNISMEIKNDVTTKTEVVEVEVFNYTGRKLTTGEDFKLEKHEGDEWVAVPFAESYTIEETAPVIQLFQVRTFRIHLNDAFGKLLDAGEYRLSKSFVGLDLDSFTVTATFAVSEA